MPKKENKEIPVEPINTEKPSHSCWVCKQNKWEQIPSGAWVCGVCHPEPKYEPHRVGLPSDNMA